MTDHHGAKVAQALALALASALETGGMSVAALARLSGALRLKSCNWLA
ncbi:hypothetical protein [Streptomyces atroolivaceus]